MPHLALAVGVDGGGDHDAHLGDAALLAHPLGERVEPEVAVRTAVERPLEEAPNDGVELGADPRHLALGDALAAQRAHEVVDPPRGDALHVRLLDHCEQGALGAPPGLEQGGEVAALAQLRDLQLDAAGARVPAPRPVAVTPGEARLAALAVAGAHLPGDLGLHHRLGQHRDRLAQEVDVTPGRLLAQQLQQVHALPDHRSPPSCSLDLHEDGAVVFYVHLCDTTSWDATFGAKVAVWIDELCRHVERLRQIEPRLFVAMLGGGGGTAASFDGHGPTLQARIGELLGFGSMPLPSRTTYDHMTEYVLALAMLDTSCGKAAREVRTLMAEEFGEVEEPVPPGSVGSSTMPQKRNPKLCQDIIADETEVRSLVPLALEAMLGDHEADGSRSMMIDRALRRSLELTGDILVRLLDVVTGLRVFPDRMRRNLDLSGGMIMSESLMLTLGRGIGRQRAHDVVYEAAQEAAVSGESFASVLARDEEVAAQLGVERLAGMLDPTRYTGDSARQASEQAERALPRGRGSCARRCRATNDSAALASCWAPGASPAGSALRTANSAVGCH